MTKTQILEANKDAIIKKYFEDGVGTRLLGREYGCSSGLMYTFINKYRPTFRKQREDAYLEEYNDEIAQCLEKGWSLRKICRYLRVPLTTLRHHIRGRVQFNPDNKTSVRYRHLVDWNYILNGKGEEWAFYMGVISQRLKINSKHIFIMGGRIGIIKRVRHRFFIRGGRICKCSNGVRLLILGSTTPERRAALEQAMERARRSSWPHFLRGYLWMHGLLYPSHHFKRWTYRLTGRRDFLLALQKRFNAPGIVEPVYRGCFLAYHILRISGKDKIKPILDCAMSNAKIYTAPQMKRYKMFIEVYNTNRRNQSGVDRPSD